MTQAQPTRFIVGHTYNMRSACNYDCVWSYKIIARTEATITTECGKRLRINKKMTAFTGSETVYPLGTYSMAPSLEA
jgi:hypothetical protein